MQFKSKACPRPSDGHKTKGGKIVIPDQSMSLQTILERFTRNEALPIGRDGNYHESEDDLEKVANSDLVDKAEFVDKMKQTKKNYEKQERKRQEAVKKAAEEKIEQEIRDKLAREKGAPPDPAK